MGTTISMIIIEKTDGMPFHQLPDEKREAINQELYEQEMSEDFCYKEPEEIFSAGNHFELMDFFEKSVENLANTAEVDDYDLYYYIDKHNVEQVMEAARQEIDRLVEVADRYNPETYLAYGMLNRLAEFHEAIKKMKKDIGFETHYLIIDIG